MKISMDSSTNGGSCSRSLQGWNGLIFAMLMGGCLILPTLAYADRDDDEDLRDKLKVCDIVKFPKHRLERDICIDYCIIQNCQNLSTKDWDYKDDVKVCDLLASQFLKIAGYPLPCIQNASMTVTKLTDGLPLATPALKLLAGGSVNWSYNIKNTGNIPVTINSVIDTGSGNATPTIICVGLNATIPITIPTSLAAGATLNCSASGTAIVGAYSNTVKVTATDGSGNVIVASDTGSYQGLTPGIMVTVAPSVAQVTEGGTYSWTVSVANTGGFNLTSITYSNDTTGAAATCPTTLAAGATATCASGTLTAPNVANPVTGSITANASYVDGANVTHTLPADTGTGSISVVAPVNPFAAFFGTSINASALAIPSACYTLYAGVYTWSPTFNQPPPIPTGSLCELTSTQSAYGLYVGPVGGGGNADYLVSVGQSPCIIEAAPEVSTGIPVSPSGDAALQAWCVPGTTVTINPQ